MGYFDGLTASSFKKDAEGRELFFFWGKLGKGRVIPTPEDGAYARSYLKIFYICLLVAVVPFVLYAGRTFSAQWIAGMAAFLMVAFIGLTPLWLRVRTWPSSEERITLKESWSASATGHGTVSLVVLIVSSAIMTLGGLLVMLATDGKLVGLFCTIFFGACLALFVFMLRVRNQS
jgi:hypothetical protein